MDELQRAKAEMWIALAMVVGIFAAAFYVLLWGV